MDGDALENDFDDEKKKVSSELIDPDHIFKEELKKQFEQPNLKKIKIDPKNKYFHENLVKIRDAQLRTIGQVLENELFTKPNEQ